MERKMIVCIGPICSGKTTWSLKYLEENPHTLRFCFDDFLWMTTGCSDLRSSVVYSSPSVVNSLLARGDVVVDGFPLNIDVFRTLINMTHQYNATVIIRLFDVRPDDAIKRNIARKKKTGVFIEVKEIMAYRRVYRDFITSNQFQDLINSDRIQKITDDFSDVNYSLVL